MNTVTISQNTSKTKLIYWVATITIMLFDAGGAIGFNSQLAIEGTRHLGFPDYFRIELGIGKIIGGIILLVPKIPARVKEWTYVAFGISTFSAIIANAAVDGPLNALLPLVCLIILSISYIYFHKLQNQQ